MQWQTKVDRVNELVREIKEREAELTALFGGEQPKRTWSRKPKENGNGHSGAVEAGKHPGAATTGQTP